MMQAAAIIQPSDLDKSFQALQLEVLHDVLPFSLLSWSLWLMSENFPAGNLKAHSKDTMKLFCSFSFSGFPFFPDCCCLFGVTDKCMRTIELAGVYGVTNRSYFDVKNHACKARWTQVGRNRQKLDSRTLGNKILLILGLLTLKKE